MSGGGATTTTNSCNGSPILHGPTTHRRRVADLMDAEKGGVDCYASSNGVDDNEDDDWNSNNGGGGGGRIRIIRCSSSLPKRGRCVVSGACASARRNVGRTIFWALMAMVVVSVFVKVSFFMVGRSNVEEEEEAVVDGKKSRDHQGGGGLLIRQTTFKDDWVLMAQKVVSDDVESSSRSVLSKGLLEKYPVAVSTPLHHCFFCLFVS